MTSFISSCRFGGWEVAAPAPMIEVAATLSQPRDISFLGTYVSLLNEAHEQLASEESVLSRTAYLRVCNSSEKASTGEPASSVIANGSIRLVIARVATV